MGTGAPVLSVDEVLMICNKIIKQYHVLSHRPPVDQLPGDSEEAALLAWSSSASERSNLHLRCEKNELLHLRRDVHGRLGGCRLTDRMGTMPLATHQEGDDQVSTIAIPAAVQSEPTQIRVRREEHIG